MADNWKWFCDLDEQEKAEARVMLAEYPCLWNIDVAWDGKTLLTHARPPMQASSFQDYDGRWTAEAQAMIDTGEMFDTMDGGVLMLVPVEGFFPKGGQPPKERSVEIVRDAEGNFLAPVYGPWEEVQMP